MKANLFACQFFYGLLSFPFLVFLVPFFVEFICKVKPTAYDRDGNTCPKYVGELWYQKKYGKLFKLKMKLEKKAKDDLEKGKEMTKKRLKQLKKIAKEDCLDERPKFFDFQKFKENFFKLVSLKSQEENKNDSQDEDSSVESISSDNEVGSRSFDLKYD
jgi:hypothetical protein